MRLAEGFFIFESPDGLRHPDGLGVAFQEHPVSETMKVCLKEIFRFSWVFSTDIPDREVGNLGSRRVGLVCPRTSAVFIQPSLRSFQGLHKNRSQFSATFSLHLVRHQADFLVRWFQVPTTSDLLQTART